MRAPSIHLLFFLVVFRSHDAHGALLDEVHAVGVVALLDDDLTVTEGLWNQRVRQVHSLIRLSKRRAVELDAGVAGDT